MKGILKKLAVVAGCFAFSAAMMAQTKALYLSSVEGTNVSQYDGQTRNVTMYRTMYKGWNTFSVPFSMTTEELEAAFGADCKLEALSTIKSNGDVIDLFFTDVKAKGIKANHQYLLYYTGENKSVKVVANETKIESAESASQFFSDGNASLSFNGATKHIQANENDVMYGIYVKDNAESAFTKVTPETSGFYATRCYLTVNGVSNPTFRAHHNVDPATAINTLKNEASNDDVYNLNGVRQNGLQKGMNITKGQKVIVK